MPTLSGMNQAPTLYSRPRPPMTSHTSLHWRSGRLPCLMQLFISQAPGTKCFLLLMVVEEMRFFRRLQGCVQQVAALGDGRSSPVQEAIRNRALIDISDPIASCIRKTTGSCLLLPLLS